MAVNWAAFSLFFFFNSSLRFKVANSLLAFLLHLISAPPPLPTQLSGPGSAGGQRHHQLQATSYPAAGYPCQPVWLSHREGRGKDKGDQRGEQAELKSTPSSLCSLRRWVQRWDMKGTKSPAGDEGKKNAAGGGRYFVFHKTTAFFFLLLLPGIVSPSYFSPVACSQTYSDYRHLREFFC